MTQGSLDLTGRHAPRCISLIQRYLDFTSDFTKIIKHTTKTEAIIIGPDGKPFIVNGEPWTRLIYTVKSPELELSFRNKWNLGQMIDFSLIENLSGLSALLHFLL